MSYFGFGPLPPGPQEDDDSSPGNGSVRRRAGATSSLPSSQRLKNFTSTTPSMAIPTNIKEGKIYITTLKIKGINIESIKSENEDFILNTLREISAIPNLRLEMIKIR